MVLYGTAPPLGTVPCALPLGLAVRVQYGTVHESSGKKDKWQNSESRT